MSASPYAAAVFLILGIALFGSGVTNPTLLTIYFLSFVPLWIGAEWLADFIRFRGNASKGGFED